MAFTFNPDLSDTVSQVRFLIQDVTEAAPYFQDETISALLLTNNNRVLDAAKCLAQALWTQYLHKADVAEVDDVRIEYRDKANQFKMLYEELSKQATIARSSGVLPIFFGGIDRAQFDNTRNDQSTVKPSFTKGGIQFDKQSPELYPVDEERYWPR
jgi:hypothetical protein